MNLQEPNRDMLESWKEIAAYLQRDAKTAQRWEKEEGLPIHRHNHKSRSSVYAYPAEIDAWRASRKTAVEIVPPPARPLWRIPAFAVTILACLMMAGNGIRPQAASAEQKRVLAKRLLCVDCGDSESDFSANGRLMTSVDFGSTGDIFIRDMSTGTVKRLMAITRTSEEEVEYPTASPDRRQIAYAWYNDKSGKDWRIELRLMPSEPGAKSRVLIDGPENQWIEPEAWFPDGKSVLVAISKTGAKWLLTRVSTADGSVKVLKSLERFGGGGGRPKFSPDFRYIVYSGLTVIPSNPPARTDPKDRHIYILTADGSSETEIVKASGINRDPVWTPDGKHILFTSDRSGKVDLWSIAVENGKAAGAESRVASDVGRAIGMVGGSYYYTQSQQSDYVHLTDLSNARATGSFVGIRPTWSPDGKSIAFKRHHPGSTETYDLVVRSLETGDERAYGASGNGAPLWFHDGKSVLTGNRRADGTLTFYRVDLQTGNFKDLSMLASALSPDDRTAYFYRGDGKTPTRVMSVDLNTGQERQISVLPVTNGLAIAVSPDGRTLALGWLDRSPGNSKLHIARVSVDGKDYREVFATDHLFGAGIVSWSQDGRSILFNQEQTEGASHWGVMQVPADGSGPAKLLIATPPLQGFDVSPDGSRIAFSANERVTELWALDNVLSVLK